MILALETGIGSGSAAILKGTCVVDQIDADVSRAENILQSINVLSAAAKVTLSEIKLIAVSTGPGSYTGIRIGIATVLGMSRAVVARVVGVPVLRTFAFTGEMGDIAAVLPIGRGRFALQKFERNSRSLIEVGPARAVSKSELPDEILRDPKCRYLIGSTSELNILSGVDLDRVSNVSFLNIENLAVFIGHYAAVYDQTGSLEPLYL